MGITKIESLKYTPKKFCSIIERRVKKNLRLQGLLRKDMKILALEPVSEYMTFRIVKNMPVEVISKNLKFFGVADLNAEIFANKRIRGFVKKEKIGAIVLPWTLDHELKEIWCRMNGENRKGDGKFVKLFLPVLEDEIVKYAELRDIKYIKMKKDDVSGFFDSIEERYMGAKFGFFKSFQMK